jgi:copper chaperone
MSTTITLDVTGMTCGGCENAVKRVLLQTPGVEQAAASHRDHRVEVTFDPAKVTVDALRDKITGLGYTVAAS